MNQTLEAFRNQFVQLDALGDKRFEVDFAFFHQFDGFGVVVAVGDGAAHVQLFHHDAVDVDGGGVAPDRDDNQIGRGLARFNQSIQNFVHAGAFECDVHAFAIGKLFHFGNHIHFGGVEDKVGQHVVVEPYIIRDDVPTGEGSNYHLSKDMNFIGLGGCGGGLAEKIAVKRRWVHPISDKIPLDQAALIEPLSVGHHAYVRSGAKAGDVALVGGAGPIGLLLAAVLKAKGIKVIITELSKARKDKARESGVADYILDPSEVDVVEEVKKLTNGEGVDVAFECTSVNKVLDTMVEACRPTAKVVIVSIWSHPATINVHSVVMKELDVRGTIAYCNDHAETIKLVEEGKINLEPFITQRIKLDELISEGFERLIHNNESAVKIIVNPNL